MTTLTETLELAVGYHQAGDLHQAEQLYLQILETDPRQVDALHLLGLVAKRLGRIDQAADYLRQAMALRPDIADVHYNLGNLLREQGNLDEAAASYRQALKLQPRHSGAYNNMANTLRQQGKPAEAAGYLLAALRLNPDDAAAHTNLGIALQEQGNVDEALACYQQSLRLRPDFVEAHYNMGIALKESGLPDEAGARYREALRLRPDNPDALLNLSLVLSQQGLIEESIACLSRAGALKPADAGLHSGLLHSLMYRPESDPQAIFREHRRWAERHEAPLAAAARPHANVRDPERPLRVGYLSPDFRQHPVTNTIEPVLARHDRARWHVTCYANVARPDSITERLYPLADCWRDIAGMPDDRVADLIRADAIDIMVDLAGHTAGQRLLVFARRPAPIQVAYSGYPGTTGMASMGFRITDAYADPPGQTEAFHSETLVRLPEIAWCFRPPPCPDVGPLPARTAGRVAFGCLNKLAKVSAPVIALWSRVLQEVPNSQLLLLRGASKLAGDRLRDDFVRLGIDAGRIQLLEPPRREEQYFALFRTIDICLDTFPYNGCVTTCNSLWMGVPVISLAGNSYVSRQGVSLLSNLGMRDWIAPTPEDYVATVKRWAGHLDWLEKLRFATRERMRRSPLCEEERFTRFLEAAYRRLWTEWCAGA